MIRGPGATVWGANAVNGVINIITKSARATRGTYGSIRGGNEERYLATGRYGGETKSGAAFRAYAKGFERDAEFHKNGDDFDGWHMAQAGFRTDADQGTHDHLTIQGDAYVGREGQRTVVSTYSSPFVSIVEEDADLSGGNLLGEWTHRIDERSDTALKFYYDRTHRSQTSFTEDRDTYDLEFRHHLLIGSRNGFLWGAGYRSTSGDTRSVPTTRFVPADRTDEVWSAFAQDEIQIVPSKWTLTLGSKFEHNDYSGFNSQPGIRLLYRPAAKHVLWSAISRALRVASRVEADLDLTALIDPTTPTFIRVTGTRDFHPERLTAYEAGYRTQPAERLFLDVAVFYNDYDRLLSLEPGTPFTETTPAPSHTIIPYTLGNGMTARVHGAEVCGDWRPLKPWRITGSYSFLRMNIVPSPESLDTTTQDSTEGSSPRHTANLRSSLDLPRNFGLDVTLRYVGRLPAQRVDAYTEMDLVISRRLTRGFEVSIAGQNLLSPHHAEFAGGAVGSIAIQRSATARLVRRW